MPKQLKEIKQFHLGIISATSTQDIPDEASSFSLNLETRNSQAYIRGANEDYLLYPRRTDSEISKLPFIKKMEMLDLGETEDLFLYAEDKGLNYICDWYNTQSLGGEWHPKDTLGIPCFAKNNKEMHIGFGSTLKDSFPTWMGYTYARQFGERVSPKVITVPAALEPPDALNVCFGVDKIVRLEVDFQHQYDYNEDTNTYTRNFSRPYINNTGPGATYAASGTYLHASRYSEEIGADCWLYGCLRGGSHIYKIKTENPIGDAMLSQAAINADQTHSTKKEGSILRSNKIRDNQGRFIVINSITPSMRYKNCLWAVSAETQDNRLFLINANDYYNIHDPQNALANGATTWQFKKDVTVLGEWIINFPNIETPNGSTELVPDGEWVFSDVKETFECEPSTNVNLADDDEPVYSNAVPNGNIYEGATGELLTHRIWISLYKEGGFATKLYNHETVEPFVFSADIMHLNHSTFGGVLNFINQTIPLRKMVELTTTNSGNPKPMAISELFWNYKDSEGPYPGGSTSGWDEIKYIGSPEGRWLDAEDLEGLPSNINRLHFGNNLGFVGEDISVKVHKFPLSWTYGKCGAKFWEAISAVGAPNDAYDTYNWKTTKDTYGDIHQMLVLCESNSIWAEDGGTMAPEGIFAFEDTWIGQNSYKGIDLGIFLMLCSNKYLGEGYNHFYESRNDETDQAGLEIFDEWQSYKKEALNWKDSKALFRLDPDYFEDLEFDNIKTFTSLYNNVGNMNSSSYNNGKVFLYISEGYENPADDVNILNKTRLWAIDSRDSNSYNILWPNAGNKEREAELQYLRPIDPNASGSYIAPKEIPEIGSGVICALNSPQYPIGGHHVGNAGFLNGIAEQQYANVFFIAPTVGEYKNGVFFGIQDSTFAISSDGYYWDQLGQATGNGGSSFGKYWLSGGNDSTADNFWSGFEWPVDTSLGTLPTPGHSDSLAYGTFLCIFNNDDASLNFDNTATTDDNQLHAYDLEISNGNPNKIRYKLSYLYDNYQHSPLTSTTWHNVFPAPQGSDTGVTEIKIDVSLDKSVIPKRVTHLNVWGAAESQESFKLVAQMTLARGWSYNSETELYHTMVTDRGAKQTGESFVAATNLPETMESMKIKYTLSCVANNYHVVANCWHPLENGLEFYVLRSEHKRFDMFNWSNLWVKLPNVPTAMASYNGKVYVFDKHNMYRIDPNTFYLEDTFEGIGCAGPEAVCVTEFGMCWADTNNIYINTGSGPKKITQKILTSKEPGFGIDKISLDKNTRISFDQEKGNYSIFVSQGKEGQFTEGLEYVYIYNKYPYHGYYNIDSSKAVWSGAYKTNTSIGLRAMTAEEINEWTDTTT